MILRIRLELNDAHIDLKVSLSIGLIVAVAETIAALKH